MRNLATRIGDGWDSLGLWNQYGLAFVVVLALFWATLEALPLLAGA